MKKFICECGKNYDSVVDVLICVEHYHKMPKNEVVKTRFRKINWREKYIKLSKDFFYLLLGANYVYEIWKSEDHDGEKLLIAFDYLKRVINNITPDRKKIKIF